MSRESIATALLAGLIMLCVASTSNANLIAYNTGTPNHARMMVMSDTGANPTEIYDYGRFSGGSHLTISPSGPGPTWVAFEVSGDLYKLRTDGTELIRMLCNEGTDIYGDPYALMGQPQWSPLGTEILVRTMSHLALVPADAVARSDCSSDLEPIYFSDALIDPPVEWTMGWMATWNDDGSKIAFFEQPPGETYLPPYNRLVFLVRQLDGSWAVDEDEEPPIYPTPGLPDSSLLEIDWQRGGDLVAFVGPDDSGCCKLWLMWVDLATDTSGYFLTGGARIEGRSPSWSPDGSQLIFEDRRDKLVKWTHVPSTFPDGAIETIGSGKSPDWQRDLVVVECGDGVCAGAENQCSCEDDCGAYPSTEADLCDDFADNDCDGPIDCEDSDCIADQACIEPFCGDETCDENETQCSCPEDCGTPPLTETNCSDGVDNDCFGDVDCDDVDCAGDPACSGTCGAKGDDCAIGADCCSGLCHPKKRVCK